MARPQPMLAYQGEDGQPPSAAQLLPHFPLWGSFKKDGIRAVNVEGQLRSRTWKPIRSAFAQGQYGSLVYANIDGELLCPRGEVGDDMTLFHASQSRATTINDKRALEWHVFDLALFGPPTAEYARRHAMLQEILDRYPSEDIKLLEQRVLYNYDDVLAFEAEACTLYDEEGIIIRRPDGIYKPGRSTLREGYLMKFCRWERDEAQIIGFEEQLENTNEAQEDSFGRTKRSTHQAGMRPKGVLGAFVVRSDRFGDFKVGGGPLLDAKSRAHFWGVRAELVGSLLHYRYKPYGVKDKPRIPQAIGIRSRDDL